MAEAARDRAGLAPALALGAAALAVAALRLGGALPPADWAAAILAPGPDDARQLVFHHALLPRIAVALLCGAALGLAGALLQQVLRNPLASPTTLGVEAGAGLSLTAAVLMAPGLLALPFGREAAALAGAAAAGGLVFAVAWARGLSSLSLVLAGLVVGLFCGALGAALKLLNQEFVAVLYLWGAGSLAQGDWSAAAALAPGFAVLAALAALLRRPFELLALDEESVRALGLSPGPIRLAGVALAVLLTALVTAAVGVIGFVGLAAPQIARLAGARTFGRRLVGAPLVGGFGLLLVDQALAGLSPETARLLPTGTATALLGAPLLVWLLPRARLSGAPPAATPSPRGERRRAPGPTIAALAVVLSLVTALALGVGRGPDGFHLSLASDAVATWRLPRVAVALAAGAMLAVAGVLLQRLAGNPIASPEVLGIGTGVAFGLVLALLAVPAPDAALRLAAGAGGAGLALALLFSGGVRARFAPEPLLLTGLALAALLDALVVAFLALGDPRAGIVLAWISGSTYGADAAAALRTGLVAAAGLAAAAPLVRWLDILPLGPAAAAALGVPLAPARLAILALAALLTAAAMLVAGPLSFVGLMGPHLARGLGLARAGPHLVGAALVGAAVMVLADALGRVAIAPRELPAGLVASLIGGPYLIWHLTRRPQP